jgi:ABC-type multidrug transport system fused ATPase/permease subunit
VLGACRAQAAEELVSNIRTVKLFAQEDREKKRFGLKMDAAYEQARQVGVASGWFEGAVHLAANMSLLTVLGYGGTLVVDGALTAGELTSFIVYSIYVGVNFSSVRHFSSCFQYFPWFLCRFSRLCHCCPCRQLSAVYADLMKAIGAGARIFEVADRQPQLPVRGGETLDSVTGQVTFENVTFAYPLRPERNVLEGFNMNVDPGKVNVLVTWLTSHSVFLRS